MREVKSFSSLYSYLSSLPEGGINGNADFFDSNSLIDLIEAVRKRTKRIEVLTSACGLRAKVQQLLLSTALNYQDGIRQSQDYNSLNGDRFLEVPLNGMVDGGGSQQFFDDKTQAETYAKAHQLEVQTFENDLLGVSHREFIRINRESDTFLRKALERAKKNEGNAPEEQIKLLAQAVHELCGPFNTELAGTIYGTGDLGEIIEMGGAVCRHRSLFYHLLACEAGLSSALRKGYIKASNGYMDGHAWNEVLLNGEWQVVDTSYIRGSVDSIHRYEECQPYYIKKDGKYVALNSLSSAS